MLPLLQMMNSNGNNNSNNNIRGSLSPTMQLQQQKQQQTVLNNTADALSSSFNPANPLAGIYSPKNSQLSLQQPPQPQPPLLDGVPPNGSFLGKLSSYLEGKLTTLRAILQGFEF